MFTTTFESYVAIGWTVCAPVGQHRIFQLVQFLNFLNFQNHREHIYINSWKIHRNRMNGVFSYTGHTHAHRHAHTHAHAHTKTLIFIYRLNLKNHRKNVYNNFWKLRRNRMNGVCCCKATPDTPASTIFKIFIFPKPPWACWQYLVKVSSQSDERCVLL